MADNEQQAKGKRFATVRFHDGYDIEQVDDCLEELEKSLSELELRQSVLEEANGLLRAQVTRAHERADAAEAELARLQEASTTEPADPSPSEAAAFDAPIDAPTEDHVQRTSRAAARLLEIATGESESLVETAREEAARIVTEARSEADRLTQSALADIEGSEQELATRQAEVETRISRLLDLEHQSRSHLVTFFQAQLDELDKPSLADATAGDAEPPLALPGS